ncbi:protein FAM104A [Poeciliopsis prolifica]|uniref:protein FAM104A n=1 Tax=Poeciliopsis prolifica TaxID=188132 RepID=UPI00072C7ED9|nr:protein FAM104A [Poeciliopsis prolifica]
MLTGNRKRRRSGDGAEEQQLNPQAKRSGADPCLLVSDLDSESSSSDSSNGTSSPERAAEASAGPSAGPSARHQKNCGRPEREDSAGSWQRRLHGYGQSASYDHINRVLREAHFSSLQTRGWLGST